MSHRGLLSLLIAFLFACLSCGGGGDPASPGSDPGSTVGPTGGTVEADGGRVSLIFPAGALSSEVAITVSPATGTPADGRMIGGSCYEFGPDGLNFTLPVGLRIIYDPADLPAGVLAEDLRLCKAVGQSWLPLAGSSVDTLAHEVLGSLNGFSTYGPGDPEPPASQSIAISPDDTVLTIFGEQDFELELTGIDEGDVVWSILESPFGGTVAQDGHFLGPGWLGVFHVVAALDGFPAIADTAVVRMAQGEFVCVNQDLIHYEQGVTFEGDDIYDAQMEMPLDAEWYGGFLWVSDTNHQVLRKFSEAGEYLGATGKWRHCWLDGEGLFNGDLRIGWVSRSQSEAESELECGIGGGYEGDELGALEEPCGIAFDPGGLLFVADSGNYRIQIFNGGGAAQGAWGEEGTTPGTLGYTIGLAVDPTYVYVMSGGYHIQKFTHGGQLIWSRPMEFGAQVMRITGIAVDEGGNIYLVDQDLHRLTVLSPVGDILFTWGDMGENMYTDDCMLSYPRDIELDSEGNIYILDNKGVAILSPTGNLLGRVAEGGQGLGIDTALNFYIVTWSDYQVHKWGRVGD